MAERQDPEKSSEKLLNKFFSSSDEGMPPTPDQADQPSQSSQEQLEVDYPDVQRRPGLKPTEDDFSALEEAGIKIEEEPVKGESESEGDSAMERLVQYVEFRLADEIGQAVRQYLVDQG